MTDERRYGLNRAEGRTHPGAVPTTIVQPDSPDYLARPNPAPVHTGPAFRDEDRTPNGTPITVRTRVDVIPGERHAMAAPTAPGQEAELEGIQPMTSPTDQARQGRASTWDIPDQPDAQQVWVSPGISRRLPDYQGQTDAVRKVLGLVQSVITSFAQLSADRAGQAHTPYNPASTPTDLLKFLSGPLPAEALAGQQAIDRAKAQAWAADLYKQRAQEAYNKWLVD